jgi:hypothetical protein
MYLAFLPGQRWTPRRKVQVWRRRVSPNPGRASESRWGRPPAISSYCLVAPCVTGPRSRSKSVGLSFESNSQWLDPGWVGWAGFSFLSFFFSYEELNPIWHHLKKYSILTKGQSPNKEKADGLGSYAVSCTDSLMGARPCQSWAQ